MSGKKLAVANGNELKKIVIKIAIELGLQAHPEYKVGRRLWGSERKIDVVLIHPETRKILGVECKFQEVSGTTEEKIPTTIQDIKSWPIPGLVVFSGKGISKNMESFLISTGMAVELSELKEWLKLFFGIV